ncbi:MAG: hypothetical protein Q7T81_16070 [Pseudolabrys sp.]|nr:hypothetical protein [Pseudolabrys sp.]
MKYNLCEISDVALFRSRVMADDALAARLYAMEDADEFIAQLISSAASLGMHLSETALLQAARPDPANISRFMPRPPDGTVWPSPQWLPMHVSTTGNHPMIDWAWFGDAPLTEPFLEDSIRRVMRRPFNRLFTYRMTLADFLADARRHESLTPDGFILHMSRCGSTLVAQMLAALPENIVISEAAPVDSVVQFIRVMPTSADLLPAIIAAYGRRRSGSQRRYFLKLDCWHTLALPLLRQTFAATPWIFLYRDPVEVLVSHMRQRGAQMVPMITPPELYGLACHTGHADPDYCARVLGVICEAAAAHLKDGGMAINYRDLPGALASRILPHFGVHPSAPDLVRMTAAAQRDAKAPAFAFTDDRADKQAAASETLRVTAEKHLGAVYRRLVALHFDGGGFPL